MSDKKVKELKKEEIPYLSASDIVNGAGPMYAIREVEMESAINEILNGSSKDYDY